MTCSNWVTNTLSCFSYCYNFKSRNKENRLWGLSLPLDPVQFAHYYSGVKKKECEVVGVWIRSAVNHAPRCAKTSGGNGDLVVAKWRSSANHVHSTINIGQFAFCIDSIDAVVVKRSQFDNKWPVLSNYVRLYQVGYNLGKTKIVDFLQVFNKD